MLQLEHVFKRFDELEVIKDLTLSVDDGEIVAMIGPSGCGKSTLLNMISGLCKTDKGTIKGNEGKIGYMFQQSRLLPWRTLYENIRLVRDVDDKKRIDELIEMIGLKGFENYYPNELSGGMARRVSLARAFYYDGDIELFDEPFSGLDYGIRMELIERLLDIWKDKRTPVLFVTHEIDEALMIATRIAVMSERPTTITKLITLPGKEGRNPSDSTLQEIRQDILSKIK